MGKKYKYIMTGLDFADLEPSDIIIERVDWEYWNGIGWKQEKIFSNLKMVKIL